MLNSPSAQCVGETQWRKERGNGARDLLNFVEFRERRWGVLIISSLLYFWLSSVSRLEFDVEKFDALDCPLPDVNENRSEKK